MTAPVERVTAQVLVERLRRHYIKPGPLPGGIFLAEVGLNGPGQQRRCDAVHVGFTSASGRILTGHEIKVSRSDWLHELEQPTKAARWADECHAWYVVAPDTVTVRTEELPHGWGLMVPSRRTTTRMDVVVKAAVHEDVSPSWLIVRSILARYDTLRAAAISDARRDQEDAARRRIEQARNELAAQGTALADPVIARIARIVDQADAQLRDGNGYVIAADEDIVAAIVDHARARRAAADLRLSLQQVVRDTENVVEPFRSAYGELASLVREAQTLAGAA